MKKTLNLRKVVAIAICLAITATIFSCRKENDEKKVEANGLTKEINNLIPAELLKEIEDMGMPIYRGDNPPKDITGIYVTSPNILFNSNIVNDYYPIGYKFADEYYNYENQDNKKLTITVKTRTANAIGEGSGAFIVGNGEKFSIFCLLNKERIESGHKYKTINIYSGIITTEGIKDFYSSIFMLEGGGKEWGLIENGKGRVTYDQDGLAERTTWPNYKSFSENNLDEFYKSAEIEL